MFDCLYIRGAVILKFSESGNGRRQLVRESHASMFQDLHEIRTASLLLFVNLSVWLLRIWNFLVHWNLSLGTIFALELFLSKLA